MTSPGMMRSFPISRGSAYSVVFLFLLAFLLSGVSLWKATGEVNRLRSAVLTTCRFDADLGTAPITVSPATGKPSKLGLSIIADSRSAWHGLGCPGRTPPAAPSFVKWARYYHLPTG